jgi:hypothetical protein
MIVVELWEYYSSRIRTVGLYDYSCMVRVETRNAYGLFSFEILLLCGVQIFMFVLLCIAI